MQSSVYSTSALMCLHINIAIYSHAESLGSMPLALGVISVVLGIISVRILQGTSCSYCCNF